MRDARKVLKTMRAVPVGVFDSKDYVADFFSGNSASSKLLFNFEDNRNQINVIAIFDIPFVNLLA